MLTAIMRRSLGGHFIWYFNPIDSLSFSDLYKGYNVAALMSIKLLDVSIISVFIPFSTRMASIA